MSIIDKDLVRAINSGRCFALIGSGASCELGIASWRQLCEQVINNLSHDIALMNKCNELMDNKDYPEVFSIAEKSIGKEKLLDIVDESLKPLKKIGSIYQSISEWPFSCYLTTNFDDCLKEHLLRAKVPVVVKKNSQVDLRTLRADSKDELYKIHGDILTPNDIVLTSEQYLEFQSNASRSYWRDKIMSVLNMVRIVIIGYSASDPDFREQLERAKQIASPDHPVFMFAADMTADQIRDYYQKYNIRIIPYENTDGTHRNLRRVLEFYNPFIVKRNSPYIGTEVIDESVASLASAMYLFTQLRLEDNNGVCLQRAYSSLILQILSNLPNQKNIPIKMIEEKLVKETFASTAIDPVAFHEAINSLYEESAISFSTDDSSIINLEATGKKIIDEISTQKEIVKEKFEQACYLSVKEGYDELKDEQIREVVNSISNGIVRAYERRGMEIAKSIFTNDIVDISNATDILDIINKECPPSFSNIQGMAFADLMIHVMLEPDQCMKDYLALLSQGYFAYHALGLDPGCSNERFRMALEKDWILDSSVLLPAIAINCMNHLYAKDLIQKIKKIGLNCYTTERLFLEVFEHATWAINNFVKSPPDDPKLLQAIEATYGYKANLFLDGYIKWSTTQGNPNFKQYIKECLGNEYEKDLILSIREKLQTLGINIKDFIDWPGMTPTSYVNVEQYREKIQEIRLALGTFRGDNQCIAEAEVFEICTKTNSVFISQSGVLNRLAHKNGKLTWKPEAMYRFLSLFSSSPIDKDLLYQCMVQDFYYAGFHIIDKKTISTYVQPMTKQARMQIEQEKDRYEEALGKVAYNTFREGFEHVPDEQKPFYSMQFAHYVALHEIKKREAAEKRAEQAIKTSKLTDKERKEYIQLKAEKDERRRRYQKRVRRQQSEGKNKKKRK